MSEEKKDTVDLGEVVITHDIVISEQGRELHDLKLRVATLERALNMHVNNFDTAHKV